MTSIASKPLQLSCENQPKFQEVVEKTKLPYMALKMWEMLNRSEKQKLGGNGVTDAKGFTSAVQVYQAVHGGSPAEAAVKAAERLKFIDINTRAELLDEIYGSSEILVADLRCVVVFPTIGG